MPMIVSFILVGFFLCVGYISLSRRKAGFTPLENTLFTTHVILALTFLALGLLNFLHVFDTINTWLYTLVSHSWHSRADMPMILVSEIFNTQFVTLSTCFILLFLHYKKQRRLFFFTLGTIALSALSFSGLKLFFHTARPALALVSEGSFAFPSAHATMAVAFFGTLYFVWATVSPRSALARRSAQSAAVLLCVIVGASRIYLGAHWLTDVIGGYLLGLFWYTFAYLTTAKIS